MPPLSFRLPKDLRQRLDRVAARMQRTRSFVIRRALEKYLDAVRNEAAPAGERRLATLLSLAGAGVAQTGPRSAEEIDAHIRWLCAATDDLRRGREWFRQKYFDDLVS